jgi:hypothetical protein
MRSIKIQSIDHTKTALAWHHNALDEFFDEAVHCYRSDFLTGKLFMPPDWSDVNIGWLREHLPITVDYAYLIAKCRDITDYASICYLYVIKGIY